jgi:hypothetical protein
MRLAKAFKSIAPIALVALFAVGAVSASAGTIQFTTVGMFNGNSSSSITSTGSPASTLTFTGLTSPVLQTTNGVYGAITVGTFDLYVPAGANGDSFSSDFTLTITQTLPTEFGGSGSSVATLTGTVSSLAGPAGGSAVVLNFNPATILIPGIGGVSYIPDNVTIISSGAHTTKTLDGLVLTPLGFPDVTPLPTASFGAMGLFSIMGFRRSRRSASAA